MPFCTKCGSKLRDGAKFCSRCGQAVRISSSGTTTGTTIPKTMDTRQPVVPSRIYDKTTTGYTAPSSIITNTSSTVPGISAPVQEKKVTEPISKPTSITTSQVSSDTDTSRRKYEGESKQSTLAAQSTVTSNLQPTNVINTPSVSVSVPVSSKISAAAVEKEDQEKLMTEQVPATIESTLGPKSLFDESILKEPKLTGSTQDAISLSASTARSYIDVKGQIKAKLENLKYNFKYITWADEYSATTTFISGSIKQLDWNIEDTLHLKAILEKGSPKLDFSFHLNTERPPYDWTNPFQSVELILAEENEDIEQKIRRESNVIEKISKLIGEITIHVTENIVIMEIEANAENVRLALDVIKELAWMITITLN